MNQHQSPDAAIIQLCADHARTKAATNAGEDGDGTYERYRAVCNQLDVVEPASMVGILAKCRAAKFEALMPDGGEDPSNGPAADWAWAIVNDLLRLFGADADRELVSQPEPAQKPQSPPRNMELLGLTEDDRLVLWSTGNVKPVCRFEIDGNGWIDAGHFVILWKGHAITVHCGNCTDGRISVQFMCQGDATIYLSRAEVEEMLLGKVIPDPKQEAEI